MDWPMSNNIIGALLFVGGYALGRLSKAREVAHGMQAPMPDASIDDAQIEAAIRAKNSIEAIKLYRQRTGAGLKEAKQAVEAIAQRINVRL